MTAAEKSRILSNMTQITSDKPVTGGSRNPATIARATGRSWADWLRLLDAHEAEALPHREIAKLALHRMPEAMPNAQWWAQGTAIAYEQAKGIRVPGQSSQGDFQVTASRTVCGNRGSVCSAWCHITENLSEYDGVPAADSAHVSSTEKWHYWRLKLSDGSRVAVNISEQKGGKSTISVNHTNLESEQERERWRAYWKILLAQL